MCVCAIKQLFEWKRAQFGVASFFFFGVSSVVGEDIFLLCKKNRTAQKKGKIVFFSRGIAIIKVCVGKTQGRENKKSAKIWRNVMWDHKDGKERMMKCLIFWRNKCECVWNDSMSVFLPNVVLLSDFCADDFWSP